MKKFGYKNYLTKSLIKEDIDIEAHNKIINEFLSTMVYGGLMIKRKEKYILIEQDEVHTSFYTERRCYTHYNQQTGNIDYEHYNYAVYTLTYDIEHTTCRFDIEFKDFNYVKDYKKEILDNMSETILYKDIENYCHNLINKLNLKKYNINKQPNKTKPQLANNQSIETPSSETSSSIILDSELVKEIYKKSTRLKDVDINQTTDNTGIKNPKFKKSRTIQFKVQDMIGDSLFRHINAVKQKAESSIINWQKDNYLNEEENVYTVACDVIHTELENITANKGGETIELTKDGLGSKYDLDMSQIDNHELNKLLSVYPPELLTPIVFLSMDDSIRWGKEGTKTSKEILNYIFGNDSVFKNGLISYDDSISGELIDSEVAIQTKNGYKKIGISTKGGLNGQGAQASLISIFRLLFDKETREYNSKSNTYKERGHIFLKDMNNIYSSKNIEEDIVSFIKNNCSEYGIEIFDAYPTEVSLILLFGGLPPKYHLPMIDKILKSGKLFDMNITLNGINDVRTEFSRFVNTHFNITNVVMEILNKQKYDFAQINSYPIMSDTSFKYEWSVQYPAHFDGDVKLEKRGVGIGFHIMG